MKQTGFFAAMIFSILLASCNSKEKLIVGTWIPEGTVDQEEPELKLQFNKDKTIFVTAYGEQEKDSVTYEFDKAGNLLIVNKSAGRADKLVVIELTAKKLFLVPGAEDNDTLKLIRQ